MTLKMSPVIVLAWLWWTHRFSFCLAKSEERFEKALGRPCSFETRWIHLALKSPGTHPFPSLPSYLPISCDSSSVLHPGLEGLTVRPSTQGCRVVPEVFSVDRIKKACVVLSLINIKRMNKSLDKVHLDWMKTPWRVCNPTWRRCPRFCECFVWACDWSKMVSSENCYFITWWSRALPLNYQTDIPFSVSAWQFARLVGSDNAPAAHASKR